MGEASTPDGYNAANLLRPVEQGVVESFDAAFTAQEGTLKRYVADQITHKSEFLTKTFPRIITMGAEHPQLSGGVLYMMGLITPHIPKGSEAINSIPRRVAEQKNTKPFAKDLRPALHALHTKNEQAALADAVTSSSGELGGTKQLSTNFLSPADPHRLEKSRIINTELSRARLTRELYDMKRCYVDVTYDKHGKTIDLGSNGSQVSILNGDSKTGKSMVFLCTSGGDPPGVESYAIEYALRTGNRVYVVGQPDSASGSMTPTFANKAFADAHPPGIDIFQRFKPPTYEAHTQFFKKNDGITSCSK